MFLDLILKESLQHIHRPLKDFVSRVEHAGKLDTGSDPIHALWGPG